jgi:ABC-type sugar transport system permease subunit
VLFTVPGLAIAAMFIVYPVVATIWLSFTSWTGLGPTSFIGWSNFQELAEDADFLVAIKNNLIFAVVVTLGTVGLGTVFALALNRRVPFWRLYRFVFFLPYILPMTIAAIMWSNAVDPNYGWLTRLIVAIHPSWSVGLLGNPRTALYFICAVTIWQLAGFPMVMMLGGLNAIPREITESAELDGAGPLAMARFISLPLCKDVLATVVLLQLIFSFKVFDIIQAMTTGGPGNSTQVFGTLIYRDAFINGEFGYASAIAVVASVAIVAISLAYLAVFKPGQIERSG